MWTRGLCLSSMLFAAGGSIFGCAGTVASSAGTGDADSAATNAVVVVERTVDWTDGSRAEASARFVRVAASCSTQDALQAIGASLELPPRGTCATVTSLAGSVATGDRSEHAPLIELADVGSVTLEATGVQTRLLPRQLPDVTDVVTGVVYARAADPGIFPASTRYAVHISGGPDLDPVDLSATAPADPVDVRLLGEDQRGGAALASGVPIEFAWAPDSDDAVYVDVRPANGSGVRCVLAPAADAGDGLAHANVPAAVLSDENGVFDHGTIVVHRLHREPIHARGIDSGEVRFDFARSISYRR